MAGLLSQKSKQCVYVGVHSEMATIPSKLHEIMVHILGGTVSVYAIFLYASPMFISARDMGAAVQCM